VSMTDEQQVGPFGQSTPEPPGSARQVVNEMVDAGLLDDLMDRVDRDGLALTGSGGLLPELVKAVLERGLQAELADHLGYEKGDPAGRGSPNSRNGSSPKTVESQVGPIALDTPRDRAGSFEPRLVPKGSRRLAGLDEQIISLYAGGMTVRDIKHHLARTLGTDLSHETISKITDAVAEEVKAWQSRPLEEIYPIIPRRAGGEGP
jgi:putative transposase